MSYEQWRQAFADMLDPRTHTIEWLDAEIAEGRIKCWSTDDAAIIAEIRTYPTGARDLDGQACVGNMVTVINELIPKAEAWGRAMECDFALIESRLGWVKALAASGYALHQCCLRKEL